MTKYLYASVAVLLLGGGGWFLYSSGHVPFTEPKLKRLVVKEICQVRNHQDHIVLSGNGCPEVEPVILDIRGGKDGRRCVNAKVEATRGLMVPVKIVVATDDSFDNISISIVETNREYLFIEEADAQIEDLQKRVADPTALCKNPNLHDDLVEARFYRDETPVEITRKELAWNYYCGSLSKEAAKKIADAIPKRQTPPKFLRRLPPNRTAIRECQNRP